MKKAISDFIQPSIAQLSLYASQQIRNPAHAHMPWWH